MSLPIPSRHVMPRASRRGQRGIGFGGALILMVLIIFFATLAIRMAPAYITFLQVRSVMDNLHQKPEVVEGGPRKIMTTLSNQLNIEGIRVVSPGDFNLAKGKQGLELSLAYEVREHLFFNVDVVMRFAHQTVFPER